MANLSADDFNAFSMASSRSRAGRNGNVTNAVGQNTATAVQNEKLPRQVASKMEERGQTSIFASAFPQNVAKELT